ncbi:universal stress protein [Blastococcus sp. VKM Ac-2987]|uniref:universal stress protein n=1 Tax=Blastococcus sp. VKM Ac-2987 TaxID=3004141 RepID=UPI0022ABB783|nr:universal stress protein [Blastococcus sp. VKM Ac-2987]MCZ2860588.1 universal stress protein [Blastococcus sp. VKM Ac-2987]
MTRPAVTPPVVVGVDGSADASAAVQLAAAEAVRRSAPLELVLAFPWPVGSRVPAPEGFDGRAALHVMAELVLETAVDELRRSVPGLTVRSRLVEGRAPDVLLAAGRSAQLVCLGSRSSGSLEDVILGSTAAAVARGCACPVLVVPRRPAVSVRGRAGVVVGVADGADGAVLEAAFRAAADRACALVAVHTWRHPVPGPAHVALDPLVGVDAAQRREEELLADLLQPWTARYPRVPVRQVVERAGAAEVLLSAGLTAELLVVGRRDRRGGVLGSLRSTTNAVLHRALCPVQVVPVGEPARTPTATVV